MSKKPFACSYCMLLHTCTEKCSKVIKSERTMINILFEQKKCPDCGHDKMMFNTHYYLGCINCSSVFYYSCSVNFILTLTRKVLSNNDSLKVNSVIHPIQFIVEQYAETIRDKIDEIKQGIEYTKQFVSIIENMQCAPFMGTNSWLVAKNDILSGYKRIPRMNDNIERVLTFLEDCGL